MFSTSVRLMPQSNHGRRSEIMAGPVTDRPLHGQRTRLEDQFGQTSGCSSPSCPCSTRLPTRPQPTRMQRCGLLLPLCVRGVWHSRLEQAAPGQRGACSRARPQAHTYIYTHSLTLSPTYIHTQSTSCEQPVRAPPVLQPAPSSQAGASIRVPHRMIFCRRCWPWTLSRPLHRPRQGPVSASIASFTAL